MVKFIFFLLFSISFLLGAKEKTLPRFASMRSDNVNTHIGPGKQYPIEWKYQRQFLPVEIIAEFDTWRKIRDVEGSISWVHTSLLSGKRYGIIINDIQDLKESPADNAKVVARLEASSIVALKKIQGIWVQVESKIGKYKGWIKNSQIWGIYPYETSL